MRCRDCIFWKENIYAYRRESSGDCHVEPITIPKDGEDFCGRFIQRKGM
jgi:hypothetical protein